jgi:hypothetical protein
MNRLLGWLISFRLWRALWGRVPEHPLMSAIKPPKPGSSSSGDGCSPLLISMILLMSLPALWIVGFSFALLAIGVGGTLRGFAAAALTARGVHQERDIGRLELLGLAPGGLLGAGWVLALREFRMSRLGKFVNRYVQNAQRIIGVGGLIMVSLIVFGTLIFQFDGIADIDGSGVTPALEYVFGAVQLVVIIALWLFSDNAQSPVIGVLIGIWAGMNARRKAEAAAAAAAVYAALQVTLIAGGIFIWTLDVHLPDGIVLASIVLGVIAMRETTIRFIWGGVRRHLNASGAELANVLRL